MGMVGGLIQLTPKELERVCRDPKILADVVNNIFETDASRCCALDTAWHGVHFLLVGDAGPKEKSVVLPLYLAISASTFIVSVLFGRLLVMNGGAEATSGFLYRVLAVLGPLSFVAFVICGLLWLRFYGTRRLRRRFFRKHLREHSFAPPDAVRKVMLGGAPITDSEYYATAAEVRALAPMLSAISDDEIRRRFDGGCMRAFGIYLFSNAKHADESWFGYALDNVRRAIACYQDAARRGNAVVFSVGCLI